MIFSVKNCIYAKVPTAIFNTPDFKKMFTSPLILDKLGRLMGVEMVALPGTPFEVIDEITGEVKTPAYRSKQKLFVDMRCLGGGQKKYELPSREKIVEKMLSRVGARYIWGGNCGDGLPHHLEWYGRGKGNDNEIIALQGVDCSGLLYEAACGITPRNTSELVCFGDKVPQGCAIEPLDLIVWDGHVIIAISSDEVIEARAQQGRVFCSPLKRRLEEALVEAPDLKINRWYPSL